MDIDTMKKNWGVLNDRLEKSETVNGEAIKTLLSQKAIGEYDKLRNKEKAGLYGVVIFAIIFPIQYITGAIQYWYSFAIIEALLFGLFIYSLIVLRALPKPEEYQSGIVGLQKSVARYQKLYAFNAPLMVAVIGVALILFFSLEGKGFQSDAFHQGIFFFAIALVTGCASYGYKITKKQLAEIYANLEELRKFETE
ncbi:MAG: hypothetical protein NC406_02805 [Bacteroides sp.]|nr:hypothetical protein [Bacteroides sp.]MCM1095041.1 hypothetical protein [Terasakiella sp.]